jgi:hypothetical protein
VTETWSDRGVAALDGSASAVPAQPTSVDQALFAGVDGTVLAQAAAYLRSRQCATGGFCFYRSAYLEEPNLHDTWHALAALRLLGGRPRRRGPLIRFVTEQPVQPQPYGLHYRVHALELLDAQDAHRSAVIAAVDALPVDRPALRDDGDASDELERLRLTLDLKRRFSLPFPASAIAEHIRAREQRDGGFGTPPNLVETALSLAVLALCGGDAGPPTQAFVTRMADRDFGFRLTEHALAPALTTTCAGISCCRQLKLGIPYPDAARTFILACQTGDGGFARAPGALPDIALTHLALAGLTILAGGFNPSPDGGLS